VSCAKGDSDRFPADGEPSTGLKVKDGALLASIEGGRHSGQSGRSGGSSEPVASRQDRCHPKKEGVNTSKNSG
jgi:hypothetical protein